MDYKDFKNLAEKINNRLLHIPKKWDGENAILDMKRGCSPNWKQMEWIGFYFEFLSEKRLVSIDFNNINKKFLVFDGFYKIPWDLKAHSIYDKNGKKNNKVILNHRDAVNEAIKEHKDMGIIIAMGTAIYDRGGKFKRYHDTLKGDTSSYEKKRIKRDAPSRMRKYSFSLRQIAYIKINKELFDNSGVFQKGFMNSNGKERGGKVLLNLKDLEIGKNIYYVDISASNHFLYKILPRKWLKILFRRKI